MSCRLLQNLTLQQKHGAQIGLMRWRDQMAAGGEGHGERFQDEIARLERAADVGDWNRCGYVGYVGEERSYERGNHIGLFACGVEEDVEGASVSGLSGMAGQLGERGDACAVGDVLLRKGDDIEIVGKIELRAYQVIQRSARIAPVGLAGEGA